MIPAAIDPKTPSPGEVDLFKRLRDDPGTASWSVLHSLDIPHHQRQLQGELDFLVVVPGSGVACLEVKAHLRVRRGADGLWHLGADAPTPRSPFRQASDAMHSVKDRLNKRRPDLSRILFWSAVCFTSVDFALETDEWHPWQVIDSRELRSRPISASIEALLARAAEHVESSPAGRWFDRSRLEPTAEQADAIISALRPEFEFFQSPKARRQDRDEELKRYTEEQFGALDAMAAGDRVIFEGPAGTGKTLLAIEAARRAVSTGDRVLLCCYNRLLGKWMTREAEPLGEAVYTGTLHKYMIDLTSRQPPDAPRPDFWEHELPEAALACLLEGSSPHAPYDMLVVDEAQDLLKPEYLDVLDLSLRGGLASGRWQMFGDFERQAIYGSGGLPIRDVVDQRSPGAWVYRLSENCRNTPRIASLIGLLAGFTSGYRRVRRPDNGVEPQLLFYVSPAGQVALLESALEELAAEGFGGGEVVVLSRHPGSACADGVEAPAWKRRFQPPERARGGDIRSCSIHAFKGLEAPAIIVTDVTSVATPEDEALLYVAITRATERLYVLADDAVRPHVIELVLSEKEGPGKWPTTSKAGPRSSPRSGLNSSDRPQ